MTDDTAQPGVQHFTIADPKVWFRPGDQEIYLGDVLDAENSEHLGVGFARYAAGEHNDWTITYDEALIVTRGRFTVEYSGGAETAGPGEVLFLRAGTELTYRADEDSELVYVAYPHWLEATQRSPHAAQMDAFRPA